MQERNEESSDNGSDSTSNTERNTDRLFIGECNLGRSALPEDKESQQEGGKEDYEDALA
jgi:hypothetical protein